MMLTSQPSHLSSLTTSSAWLNSSISALASLTWSFKPYSSLSRKRHQPQAASLWSSAPPPWKKSFKKWTWSTASTSLAKFLQSLRTQKSLQSWATTRVMLKSLSKSPRTWLSNTWSKGSVSRIWYWLLRYLYRKAMKTRLSMITLWIAYNLFKIE